MLLSRLVTHPPDALLSLIQLVEEDQRPDRIDLTVGVYRDAAGVTPVMRAVKIAEEMLLQTQETKTYLGADGDKAFVRSLAPHALGRSLGNGVIGLQTPGGTGALRLAADLFRAGGTSRRVLIGLPCWNNHLPILEAAGLELVTYRHYDPQTGMLDGDAILRALDAAHAGDAVLLQACCHNPTGADPDSELWSEMAARISARGLIPILDFAYQGLGDGWTEDATGVRMVLDAVPEALVAYSCDKNFGLYRDRVGALFVLTTGAQRADLIRGNLLSLARASYSMPPDHGAAVAGLVLSSNELTRIWAEELAAMRYQIQAIRADLATFGQIGEIDLAQLADKKGMFALLPLQPDAIELLRHDHAIYMAGNGRINLAGLARSAVPRFVKALDRVQTAVPV